jgi:hypothetical protein
MANGKPTGKNSGGHKGPKNSSRPSLAATHIQNILLDFIINKIIPEFVKKTRG